MPKKIEKPLRTRKPTSYEENVQDSDFDTTDDSSDDGSPDYKRIKVKAPSENDDEYNDYDAEEEKDEDDEDNDCDTENDETDDIGDKLKHWTQEVESRTAL